MIHAPSRQNPERFALLVDADEVVKRGEGKGDVVETRGCGSARRGARDGDNCDAVMLTVVL